MLINSVLLSIHVYWAQVMVLPRKVLNEIDQMCRAYLWSGDVYSGKAGYVAWPKVCLPKQAGGLGLRNISVWNTAAMGKYVWAITKKKDSLWLKWVSEVYVHNDDWWDYKALGTSSWYWRKVCEVKDQLKLVLSETQLRGLEMYSIRGVYKILCGDVERVEWDKVVWNIISIPKHRFFMWLTMKQRMQTTERMYRIGVSSDPLCLICGLENESQEHLFFSCRYSLKVLVIMRKWLQLEEEGMNVPEILQMIRSSRCTQLQKKIKYAIIAAIIYQIWHVRNEALWEQKIVHVDKTVNLIQRTIIDRIYCSLPRKVSRRDKEWVRQRCLEVCK